MDAAGPEFLGEGLATARAARDGPDLRDAQTQRGGGLDAEPRHCFNVGGVGEGAEFREYFFGGQLAVGLSST